VANARLWGAVCILGSIIGLSAAFIVLKSKLKII